MSKKPTTTKTSKEIASPADPMLEAIKELTEVVRALAQQPSMLRPFLSTHAEAVNAVLSDKNLSEQSTLVRIATMILEAEVRNELNLRRHSPTLAE